MERKVGEIFTTKEGVKIEVVEKIGCKGCFYNDKEEGCLNSIIRCFCHRNFRADNKSVIFKQIDETNNH